MRRYEQFLRASEKVAFSILVWGPSPKKKGAVSRKRKQIRDSLIKNGHNAMFSEDIPPSPTEVSEKSKEFAQALAAHMVIVLVEDAPGALAEAHDFCEIPELIQKIFVLVPKKYEAGYSSRGALADLSEGYGSVYWYEESELKSCQVLARAIRRVEARRHIQVRSSKA